MKKTTIIVLSLMLALALMATAALAWGPGGEAMVWDRIWYPCHSQSDGGAIFEDSGFAEGPSG